MTFWLDEQLSPLPAPWIEANFGVLCHSVVNLPVDRGDDEAIFLKARQLNAIIVSKDSDFVNLVNRLGQPPKILWITCGNKSNALMRELLISTLPHANDQGVVMPPTPHLQPGRILLLGSLLDPIAVPFAPEGCAKETKVVRLKFRRDEQHLAVLHPERSNYHNVLYSQESSMLSASFVRQPPQS